MTNVSYLYIIGPISGPQKIGFSKNPEIRLKTLQTAHPEKLILHHKEEIKAAIVRPLEKIIHKTIGHYRINNEWFDISVADAKLEIGHAIIRYSDENNLANKIRRNELIF